MLPDNLSGANAFSDIAWALQHGTAHPAQTSGHENMPEGTIYTKS